MTRLVHAMLVAALSLLAPSLLPHAAQAQGARAERGQATLSVVTDTPLEGASASVTEAAPETRERSGESAPSKLPETPADEEPEESEEDSPDPKKSLISVLRWDEPLARASSGSPIASAGLGPRAGHDGELMRPPRA